MIADAVNSIPFWLLYDDEVDEWRAARTPFIKTWLAEHNFKGEKHRVLLVPDSSGGLEMAIGGLGKRQGGLSMWHAAGFAERLPPRRFRFAQGWSDSDATQLSLGFAYGSYRFERYRPSKSDRPATIDACPNADHGFVTHAAESLKLARDLINTPAGDLGPAELAAAARHLAERHGASYRQWVGEELLAAKFPAIHAVGRASASAPRLVDLRWSPPGGEALPRLTLIGKGVCFDSGGLDIKSSSGMALMKKDMGGAAVAMGLANLLMRFRGSVVAGSEEWDEAVRLSLLMLAPAAPHITEELWSRRLAEKGAEWSSIHVETWPLVDEAAVVEATREVPVQVNGKLRDKVVVAADISGPDLEAAVLASDRIRSILAGRQPLKIIQAGGGKLVNIVVRDADPT
jgi:hypothetical protein